MTSHRPGSPRANLPLAHQLSEPDAAAPRFLSHDACVALVQQILGYTSRRGITDIHVESAWRGDVRWARNRPHMAGDWRNQTIQIGRGFRGWSVGSGFTTNQLDMGSLRTLMAWAERHLPLPGPGERPDDSVYAPVQQPYARTHIWSDQTYAQTSEQRSTIASQLITGAERAGMLSAGYLDVSARGLLHRTAYGQFLYAPQTLAQCSMTVRDPEGTGSGWAGVSSYDWGRIDAATLAEIALDKCLKSRNPVAVEPGRYTLILEPQALFDFLEVGLADPKFIDRWNNENSDAFPFYLPPGQSPVPGQPGQTVTYKRTMIGEKVVDARISMRFDPTDPDLGVIPFTDDGEAVVPFITIDHGVLTTLNYHRDYANTELHQQWGIPGVDSFRLDVSGPTATLEEMIATTRRGLLATRMPSGISDFKSLSVTGYTRDGLWLIENGKISKPVKNMRYTESNLGALNRVEQVGVPVPVFSPGDPAVCPPIKVRDFNFTYLMDAV